MSVLDQATATSYSVGRNRFSIIPIGMNSATFAAPRSTSAKICAELKIRSVCDQSQSRLLVRQGLLLIYKYGSLKIVALGQKNSASAIESAGLVLVIGSRLCSSLYELMAIEVAKMVARR